MSRPTPPSPPQPGRIPRPGRSRNSSAWTHWLPGLRTLRLYDAAWLRHDVTAGLALTAVLVPVGIAYAVASGLPAITGLYATIFGLLAYAVFGPSRVLVLGPDSSLVALVAGVVLPLSAGDPQRAMALAAMMAVVSGVLCVLAGAARLGFITELLSKPIRIGYMNGVALTVLVSQLPAFLGLTLETNELSDTLQALGVALWTEGAHTPSLLLGVGTLMMIWALQRSPRLPAVLIAVLVSTLAVGALDLATQRGVVILGPLPQGLPAFMVPTITSADVVPVLLGGLAVALVSFADTSVLSRSLAARAGRAVDANQEMIALGASNLAAGLFQGLPVSASAARTPVAQAAGARSQLAGAIGAVAVATLLVFAPTLLENLPRASLAAVVIAAAVALFDFADLRRIYRIQRWEFWLSLGSFAGVAVLGPIPGIGFAIVVAIIEFLWAGWRPYSAVLGRVDGRKGYHDVSRHPEARRVPGLVLLRWDAPLFFANAELFRERVLDAVNESPTPVRWVVIGAEPITSIDVTAADALEELRITLTAAGIELAFAEMKGPVKDTLKRFGLFEVLGAQRFFSTLGEAVSAYVRTNAIAWEDWEGRQRG